jgi:hypothetical protein
MLRRLVANSEPPPFPFKVPGLGALEKIQMGTGVVGRTSYALVAFLIFSFLAIWIFKDTPWLAALAFSAVVLIVVGYGIACFWYASKFPQHAIMDGANFVRYTEIEQSAKNPSIIDVTAEPVENTDIPRSITAQGGGDV